MVEHDHLSVDMFRRAVAHIPEAVLRKFPAERAALAETEEHLRALTSRDVNAPRAILRGRLLEGEPPDLRTIMAEVQCLQQIRALVLSNDPVCENFPDARMQYISRPLARNRVMLLEPTI